MSLASYFPQLGPELLAAEQAAANSGSQVDSKVYTVVFPAAVHTTDATPTAAFSFSLTPLKNSLVTITVQSIKADGTDGAAYVSAATFRKTATTATQIGSTVALLVNEDTAGQACTIAASSGSAVVTVTGAAATSVYWSCTAVVREIGYLGV